MYQYQQQLFRVTLIASRIAVRNNLEGHTIGHDFLIFIKLKSPDICFHYLSGNPVHNSDIHICLLTGLQFCCRSLPYCWLAKYDMWCWSGGRAIL